MEVHIINANKYLKHCKKIISEFFQLRIQGLLIGFYVLEVCERVRVYYNLFCWLVDPTATFQNRAWDPVPPSLHIASSFSFHQNE